MLECPKLFPKLFCQYMIDCFLVNKMDPSRMSPTNKYRILVRTFSGINNVMLDTKDLHEQFSNHTILNTRVQLPSSPSVICYKTPLPF